MPAIDLRTSWTEAQWSDYYDQLCHAFNRCTHQHIFTGGSKGIPPDTCYTIKFNKRTNDFDVFIWRGDFTKAALSGGLLVLPGKELMASAPKETQL